MADVEELIDYIKSLKRGFDKDLYQSKIDELSHAVDTVGLEYNDFHTLFKVWLNLSIPITKWMSLGACIIPPDRIEEKTVEYSFRWILANYENQTSFSRIGFLLDWLTAAMDTNCIDMTALDNGYEIFYVMLTFEVLTVHAMKLVYTLTKPADVTRQRVLELIDYAKKREAKKNLYRQLQVLLGLFKSYKPECVPEDIPAISIHTAFKKINTTLASRFKRIQESRNATSNRNNHLIWFNQSNFDRNKNKKAEPLVPNMEFINIASKDGPEKEALKTHLDYTDGVSLMAGSIQRAVGRPARLRALLGVAPGLPLLALASNGEHAFLSHDLHHLLTTCFLDASPHSYAEKQDLLQKLVILQRTLMQGIPIISRFLAQFVPLWNERDYFAEILDLAEWIHIENPDQIQCIVRPFTRMYQTASPLEQLAILNCLTNMYSNLMYCRSRTRYHFMSVKPTEAHFEQALPIIANSINDMCNKALQVDPDDVRVLYSSLSGVERMCVWACRGMGGVGELGGAGRCGALRLALPLLSTSAAALDKVTGLMLLYQKYFSSLKAANKLTKDERYKQQINTLKKFTGDLVCCLYNEEAIRNRQNGIVFENLHPQLVGKLYSIFPDVDSKLSIRNHLALAPYTYMQLVSTEFEADNKLWYNTVIDSEFRNIGDFLAKAISELRT